MQVVGLHNVRDEPAGTASTDGYWNSYLNEWVDTSAVGAASTEGYWNSYLNEWVTVDPS